MEVEIHPKFLPLIHQPHTFADIHGGRYGMKTEQVHKIALLRGINEPLRIVCARETMESTRDSSLKTLADIIYQYGMSTSQGGPYEVQSKTILRRSGERIETEFIFIGVRENIRDKKSLANIDLVLFDEAGKCSKDSLEVFLPTIIRKAGCRAWFIWNPEAVTDPVYQLLVQNTPRNTLTITTSYLDNPWLSEEARNLVEDCKRIDFELYEHLYLGKPLAEVKGGVFEAELKKASDNGHIRHVPHNPKYPVHTAWDLGYGDATAIWFFQAYDSCFWFIDYLEDRGRTIENYVIELQRRNYLYGTDWLPHDSVDAIIHNKLVGGDRTGSIDAVLRKAGRKVRIAPKLLVTARINAARTQFPLCRFDEENTRQGVQALRFYQWAPMKAELARGSDDSLLHHAHKPEPLHNWASHGADSFCCASVGMRQPPEFVPTQSAPSMRVVDI